jgi:dihydroorotase (multifunctional complex type)
VLDLRIVGAVVVSDGSVRPLDVGVEGGKIVEVAEPGRVGAAREEVDATGLHLLPGAVDVHFHCRAPSHPERGTFATETAAAAAGGVTTVFEMPISDPACSTPEVLRARRELIESEAHVNVALYSGAVLGGAAAAEEMVEAGAIAFKLFMVSPAAGREREFNGLWASEEGDILAALEGVSATGRICVVHAENESLVRHYQALPSDGNGNPQRPPVIEAVAIAEVAAMALATGASIHIAHVSSAAGLAAVRGGVALGASLSSETCPQYLTLDTGTIRKHGGLAKIAPPLRTPGDSAALWQGLVDGSLDMVASDHSPFLAEDKAGIPYADAPQGLPTVELLMPVLLDAAARGAMTLERAVGLITSAPARRFGLYPQKGHVGPGADADLAIVDLNETFRPSPATLVTRAAGCGIVFADMELRGRVQMTIVGGRQAYVDGRVTAASHGRFASGRAAPLAVQPAV